MVSTNESIASSEKMLFKAADKLRKKMGAVERCVQTAPSGMYPIWEEM